MALNLRQFTIEKFCLNCDGCCKFSEKESNWIPIFSEDEIKTLHAQANLDFDTFSDPAFCGVALSINPEPVEWVEFSKNNTPKLKLSQDFFFCPFFSQKENKCRIYSIRPFDCRLYPFILTRQASNKIFLGVDKKCPFVRDKMDSHEFKKFSQYLKGFLASKEAIKFIQSIYKFIPQFVDEVIFISDIKLNEDGSA